jgi:hypothetical protein
MYPGYTVYTDKRVRREGSSKEDGKEKEDKKGEEHSRKSWSLKSKRHELHNLEDKMSRQRRVYAKWGDTNSNV